MRKLFSPKTLPSDIAAGMVVFVVALPLCLGVAMASGAPILSGVLAGIIGGIVVGIVSKSHTSVSGPSAGSTAIVAAYIISLGSFEAFLAAVVIAGFLQICLGVARFGFIADFFPSSVIKGLLAAIGVILILKQIPHFLGYDHDPEGEMAFLQPDESNTISALFDLMDNVHWGAATIGIICLALLIAWDRVKALKHSNIPGALVVVVVGVTLSRWLEVLIGSDWEIGATHLVQVPVPKDIAGLLDYLSHPDWTAFSNPVVWKAGLLVAAVTTLETLLNLEAVDKLDPQSRTSPPNRELIAQGIGNILGGLIGAIPVTSVIVRSSVNINAGSKTRLSTILHGVLILGSVVFLPQVLNWIPLSCLAAILLITGYKLASPKIFRSMWRKGPSQFWPFVLTIVAIVFTDLIVGIIIGLIISSAFILHANARRPLRRIVEKHIGGEVMHLELANQVSFLHKAAITNALEEIPPGGHLLLDASNTDYIDPDIVDLIQDFEQRIAPSRDIHVSLIGFRDRYQMSDRILFADYSTRELQRNLTPHQVLRILKDGNERFIKGQQLIRNPGRMVTATAQGQFPIATVLSCIDSRSPAELIFDLGVGDIFSVRIAGNVAKEKVLGSMEYACAVAGSKLILVMGHTKCGAVASAVDLAVAKMNAHEATGCQNLDVVINEIQKVMRPEEIARLPADRSAYAQEIAKRNVLRTIGSIRTNSSVLNDLADSGAIIIVGALYDVSTGRIQFLTEVDDEEPARGCRTPALASSR